MEKNHRQWMCITTLFFYSAQPTINLRVRLCQYVSGWSVVAVIRETKYLKITRNNFVVFSSLFMELFFMFIVALINQHG